MRLMFCIALTLSLATAEAQQAKPTLRDACVCTQMFVALPLTVVNTSGAPIADAKVRVRQPRTGYAADAEQGPTPGTYFVVDDSWRERLRPSGETLRITVTRGPKRATTTLRVAVPGRCRCHVSRIAGRDTVVLK